MSQANLNPEQLDPRALQLRNYILNKKQDGVEFKAKFLIEKAGKDIKEKEKVFETMCLTIAGIPSEMVQDEYVKIVSGILDIKQANFYKKIRTEKEEKKDAKSKNDDLRRARHVADQAERKDINITKVDEDFQQIADALASLGESARDIFHRVCQIRNDEYQKGNIDKVFNDALEIGKIKTPYKFFKIAELYGLEIKLPRTLKESKEKAEAKDIIKDDDMAEDYVAFGIWEEGGVYKCLDTKNQKIEVSNFTMRILRHVETSNDEAYRLISIKNIHGHEAVINMNTDDLVSVGTFKKQIARKGNFLWKGGEIDLCRLSDKLQREEKTTTLIKQLGWNPKGKFYAFANGIFDVSENVFLPTDEHGIVQHTIRNPDGGEKVQDYFIPALSNIYADKEDLYANDKKFIYQLSVISFKEWAKQFCEVYGKQGQIGMIFYVMALFSDIIFKQLGRRFPLLSVYGKRGSGKGSMIASIMRMFGLGQDQIMLGGSSTAVGFMRKFAQYRNAIVWLDEYKNNLPPKIIESAKNLFDRIGYERGKKDNSFETESTPILSACILSGQEMPTVEPALFTRTILTSFNETKFTEEQRQEFANLQRMEEAGLSCITVHLLQYRPYFAVKFKEVFEEQQRKFLKQVGNTEIDDRLYMNYSALIATAEMLSIKEHLPFTMGAFTEMAKDNLLEQFFVLKGSDDASKFWDVVEMLFNQNIIQNERHFKLLNGLVYIRVQDIYQYYAEALQKRRDPNVLDKETLYKYLESDNKAFVRRQKKFFGGAQRHCHVFQYVEIGIDLIREDNIIELKRRYKEMGIKLDDEQGELDLRPPQTGPYGGFTTEQGKDWDYEEED